MEEQEEDVFRKIGFAIRKHGSMIRRKAISRKKRISRIEDIELEKKESLSSAGKSISKEVKKKIRAEAIREYE